MAEISGAQLIARSLKQHGIEYTFGIVGVPVVPIAFACQQEGIKYFGMRHEQSASYAAQAVSYLTGRPGACLVVSGPGMTNAISGLANAWSNCWPMLLLGGASDLRQAGMGAFQEAPQVEAARPFVKYAAQVDRVERIPYFVEQAARMSLYGRPGPVYLDLPGDVIDAKIDDETVVQPPRLPDRPRPPADPAAVQAALDVLRQAERPHTPAPRTRCATSSRRRSSPTCRRRWPRGCCPTTTRSRSQRHAPTRSKAPTSSFWSPLA